MSDFLLDLMKDKIESIEAESMKKGHEEGMEKGIEKGRAAAQNQAEIAALKAQLAQARK